MIKIMVKVLIVSTTCLSFSACTSVEQLPQVYSIGTQGLDQQYYYCESCNKPTKLTTEIVKPLEPDTSIFKVIPVVKAEPIVKFSVKKTKRSRSYKHRLRTKSKLIKQCIQWSK